MENNLLLCPKCKQPFLSINSRLAICVNKHKFKVDEGVLILAPNYLIDEKNRWSRKLRNPQANLALDEKKSVLAKKKSRKITNDKINYIISRIPKENTIVLDIATGRGLLLRQMYPALQNSTFYLNDVSAHVLVGTRKLVKPLQRTNKIIPVQSSATNLPLSDNSLEVVTCLSPNNIKPTHKAFQEILRVLKRGGKFIFATSLFEKGSPSHKYTIREKAGPNYFNLIDKWQPEVKKIGFKIKEQSIVFDGPAKKAPLDIFPRVERERYQHIGVTLLKS